MNLKPVELQIALPRTTEAGRIQNDLQQRQTLNQQQLAGELVKDTETNAQRSPDVDESAEPLLHNDADGQGTGQGSKHNQSKEKGSHQPAPHDAEHPYKGHHIDLSL